jgi:hypothetical protein
MQHQPRVRARLVGVLLSAGALLLTLGASANAATFTNAAQVSIPAGAPTVTQGNADPYPSDIAVAGVTGPVTRVNAILHGFHHTYTQDVEALLVGPTGQDTILMANVGTEEVDPASPVELTFDDAGAPVPCDTSSDVPLVAGVYAPTFYPTGDSGGNCDSDLDTTNLPAPAPAGPYTASLAGFNGKDPNGVWHLYVVDSASGDSGAMDGGWSLQLTIAAPTVTAPAVGGSAEVGQTLTATSGTIGNGGVPSYQWNRCNATGTACTPIAGATAASYKPVAADKAHTLVVTETVTNSGGSAAASSAHSALVGPATISTHGTKGSQKVLKQKGLIVAITSNVGGSVTATGTVSVPNGAKTVRFKGAKKTLNVGKKTTVKLKLSKSGLKAIAGGLSRGKKLKAKLTLVVRDANGAKSTKRITVRLKR